MKSKSTAGILALILGGFGVHKFYLGKTGMGILYAVFCWTFIPALVAFIEGIILLTMSDEAFNQKYNFIYLMSISKSEKTLVSNENDNRKKKNKEPKKTIFDFFKLDITTIPNDSFIKAEQSTNSAGQPIQTYRKNLLYKECDIFDTVEVNVIGGTSTNVFFHSFNPESVNLNALKELIDDLYLLYGITENGKGMFTNKDIEEYHDSDFYMLFGRMWSEYPKYKYPTHISRDEQKISFTIWGANEQETGQQEIKTEEKPIIKIEDTAFNQEAKITRRNWQKIDCTGTFILQESTYKGHSEALIHLKTFDSFKEYLKDNQNYYSVDFSFDEETTFRNLMNSTTKVRKFTEIKIEEKYFNPKEFALAIWLNTSKNNSEFEERLSTAKESNTPESIMKALEIKSFLKLFTTTKS